MQLAAYLPDYGSAVLTRPSRDRLHRDEPLEILRLRPREHAEIGGRMPHIVINNSRLIVFLINQKDYAHCTTKHFDFNFPFCGKNRRSCPPSCFCLLPRLAPLLPSEEGKRAEARKKAGGQTSFGMHRDPTEGGNPQHTLRV